MDAQAPSLYTAVLIVSITVGVILLFFIYSIIRQQRRNLSLYRQSVLAEITAMEKERARIAADLHDELGPVLSAIKLKINSFDLKDEDDREQMEKVNKHIDGLIRRMREISYDLIPNTLLRKGLVQAVRDFSEFVSKDQNLRVHFTAAGVINITEQKSIHVYRIIQEVINNALKHSGANSLNIELQQKDHILVLSTSDDGVGFDHLSAIRSGAGLGMRNLVNRCEIIGGQMFVESGKNKGTKYSFEIPL